MGVRPETRVPPAPSMEFDTSQTPPELAGYPKTCCTIQGLSVLGSLDPASWILIANLTNFVPKLEFFWNPGVNLEVQLCKQYL